MTRRHGARLLNIGFVPPTAILIALGVLTLASAATWPPHSAIPRAGTE
jgi:hypothetical protein